MGKAASTGKSVSTTTETTPIEGEIVQSRADAAYELLLAGNSLHEIAEKLQFKDASDVYQFIQRRFEIEAKHLSVEDRKSLLALECARLDRLQAAHWQSAMYGDLGATAAVLKIMAHRAKITGLDAVDTQTNQSTVLVVGGMEADYVSKLKKMIEPQTGPDPED